MINSVELSEKGENILILVKLTKQRIHFSFSSIFQIYKTTDFIVDYVISSAN